VQPFTKGLIVGGIGGAVLAIVLAVAGLAVLATMRDRLVQARAREITLAVPTFPEDEELAIQGEVDWSWPLRRVDGAPTTLAELRGRATFVCLWATTCPACVAELPRIRALREAVAAEGIAVVAVSREPPDTVRAIVEEHAPGLPAFVAEELPQALRTGRVPTILVIDAAGAVVHRHLGAARWDDEACVRFLRRVARAGS
jgi:peroxiredoxin